MKNYLESVKWKEANHRKLTQNLDMKKQQVNKLMVEKK